MLDKRQQFKVGFLLKAAQLGMSLSEVESLLAQGLEKQAEGWEWFKAIPGASLLQRAGEKAIDTTANVVGNLAKGIGNMGLTAAVMAPIGVGALVGHGLGRAKGLGSNETPEEEKQRELIDAYQRAAEKARMNRTVRQHRDSARSRPSYGLI